MNQANTLVRWTLSLLLVTAVIGCRKGDKNLTPIPSDGSLYGDGVSTGPAGGMMAPGSGQPLDSGGQFGGDQFQPGQDITSEDPGRAGLPDNPDAFVGKTETRLDSSIVYFDFDRYNVKQSELPKIETVADLLSGKPGSLLRIEGHCDERGTEEYNRALGERRALAIRDVLIRLGVSASRITTESWGEDRPAVDGHDESAYSRNRRGEFVLLTP